LVFKSSNTADLSIYSKTVKRCWAVAEMFKFRTRLF